MRVTLKIEIPVLDLPRVLPHDFDWQPDRKFWAGVDRIPVPEPYQAGDCPIKSWRGSVAGHEPGPSCTAGMCGLVWDRPLDCFGGHQK